MACHMDVGRAEPMDVGVVGHMNVGAANHMLDINVSNT